MKKNSSIPYESNVKTMPKCLPMFNKDLGPIEAMFASVNANITPNNS